MRNVIAAGVIGAGTPAVAIAVTQKPYDWHDDAKFYMQMACLAGSLGVSIMSMIYIRYKMRKKTLNNVEEESTK